MIRGGLPGRCWEWYGDKPGGSAKQLQLFDITASRHHACPMDPHGSLYIRDEGSTQRDILRAREAHRLSFLMTATAFNSGQASS
jgi:hypothetical protein